MEYRLLRKYSEYNKSAGLPYSHIRSIFDQKYRMIIKPADRVGNAPRNLSIVYDKASKSFSQEVDFKTDGVGEYIILPKKYITSEYKECKKAEAYLQITLDDASYEVVQHYGVSEFFELVFSRMNVSDIDSAHLFKVAVYLVQLAFEEADECDAFHRRAFMRCEKPLAVVLEAFSKVQEYLSSSYEKCVQKAEKCLAFNRVLYDKISSTLCFTGC